MKTAASRKQLEQLADEIFELTTLISTLRARSRPTEPELLSESEFVALDLMIKRGSMTVGEIQKHLGIMPAQMSRMLRALEDKDGKVLVASSINLADRRKVDVTITDAGRAAHQDYRAARREIQLKWLQHLKPEEREPFMDTIRSFRDMIAKQLKKK